MSRKNALAYALLAVSASTRRAFFTARIGAGVLLSGLLMVGWGCTAPVESADDDPERVDEAQQEVKHVDLGEYCGRFANRVCKKGLVCEAEAVPKLYEGRCEYPPGKVGDPCGGGSRFSRGCAAGLTCVYKGKGNGKQASGKHGTCQAP